MIHAIYVAIIIGITIYLRIKRTQYKTSIRRISSELNALKTKVDKQQILEEFWKNKYMTVLKNLSK